VFPHHEMCAAQGTAVSGKPFAAAYVHAGMVGYDGEKMSKSRGNLVFVSKLVAAGVDPMAIRLALLAHHYRSDWEWSADELASATARLEHWRIAAGRPAGPPADGLLAAVRSRMSDDLDAAGALAAVDAWCDAAAAGSTSDPQAPALVRATVDALLGIAL